MPESILLIGLHTRPAVYSAKAIGLYTLSVDYFGDVDLKEKADVSRSVRTQEPFKSSSIVTEQRSESAIGERLIELSKDLEADRTILTSTLCVKRKVVGNPPEKMFKLKDKELQLKKARRLGLSVPEFEVVSDREDALEAALWFGYPCIIKPARGAGGHGVTLARTGDDVPGMDGRWIVQRYVEGTPISASTLSTKQDSMLLSTSEQLLGREALGQRGFVYCGSIVPYRSERKKLEELEELSIKASKAFGVIGWNGIDFVEALEHKLNQECRGINHRNHSPGEPVFMEINPRFQGTFDCIEAAYDINLLDAHIRACEGELIEQNSPLKTAVRMTLFAREKCRVKEDLRGRAVDVPLKDSIIEEGEPVTTVISSGSREKALARCAESVAWIYKNALSPWPR